MTHWRVIHGGRSLISGDKIILLKPALVRKVWGGRVLSALKDLPQSEASSEPLGETWEISAHPDGPSFSGSKPLSSFIDPKELPYLVKLIDTSANLSIQVHPGDEYARVHEDSLGKTECWVILGANEGSGIYLGLRPGVTKEEFQIALEAQKEMNDFLVFHPVKKGDFFYVPAGAIHAIGSGVFLAEVQQSSGITYRVWDWNRLDVDGNSRELHIEKALDVIEFGDDFNNFKTFQKKEDIFSERSSKLIEHPQFSLRQITLSENESVEIDLGDFSRKKGILNLEGEILISNKKIDPYSAVLIDSNTKETLIVEANKAGSFLLVE